MLEGMSLIIEHNSTQVAGYLNVAKLPMRKNRNYTFGSVENLLCDEKVEDLDEMRVEQQGFSECKH